jgi:hypothetical protein
MTLEPNSNLTDQHFNYLEASEAVAHGWFDKASRILRRAIDESQLAGILDPALLETASDLAERYFNSGNYVASASLYRVVLSARMRVLGPNHEEVRHLRRMLAQALWQTGGLSPEVLAEQD